MVVDELQTLQSLVVLQISWSDFEYDAVLVQRVVDDTDLPLTIGILQGRADVAHREAERAWLPL